MILAAHAQVSRYSTQMFYFCLVLAAFSAIASLQKLIDAEQGARRRSDELDDDEDSDSDDEKKEEEADM